MTKLLQWNDPKMKISVVAGSFHFRTRRNDTRSSFHGMTGTRLKRPTLFGKGSPNGEKGGSNDLGFTVIPISHSCHSDRIPRSKVVLSHSGKKGTFRMTSERCRNEGRGGAEVGCFPQLIVLRTCLDSIFISASSLRSLPVHLFQTCSIFFILILLAY